MKIIFLESAVDAEHKISQFLQSKGAALLFPADLREAEQLLQLHGKSIDLLILQLEDHNGSRELALQFLEKLKADPEQSDLPVILITSWGDGECAKHQASPSGGNGYLHSPYTQEQLWAIVEGVLQLGSGLESENNDLPALPALPALLTEGSLVLSSPDIDTLQPADAESSSLQLNSSDLGSSPSSSPSAGDLSKSMAFEEAPAFTQEGTTPALVHFGASHSSSGSPDVEEDFEASQEMPYLFTSHKAHGSKGHGTKIHNHEGVDPFGFSEPIGDAVVPGGAAHSPDLETIKKYLFLREQDVAALSIQLKAAQDQTALIEQSLKEEKAKNAELTHIAHEQKQKIENFEQEKQVEVESLQSEMSDLRFQVKVKADKAKVLESQVHDISEEMSNLKERVRVDIRKIRVREKELENRIEMMRKDSEALLTSRENKITELKRKLDIVEFNSDLLQEQYSREKETNVALREKLLKIAQMLRVVGGVLDANKVGNLGDLDVEQKVS